jgi:hypothetical protein
MCCLNNTDKYQQTKKQNMCESGALASNTLSDLNGLADNVRLSKDLYHYDFEEVVQSASCCSGSTP